MDGEAQMKYYVVFKFAKYTYEYVLYSSISQPLYYGDIQYNTINIALPPS